MSGVSIIARAQQNALRMLPRAKHSKELFALAQEAVKAIADAAHQRRSAYRSQPKTRAIIRATEEWAWDLSQAMLDVLNNWDEVEAQEGSLGSILTGVFLAVQHIDGTPVGIRAEPNPDMIGSITASAIEGIRSKLPTKVRPLNKIGQDMAKFISPSALTEPAIDPDDRMEEETHIAGQPEPSATIEPPKVRDAFSPDTFDYSILKS